MKRQIKFLLNAWSPLSAPEEYRHLPRGEYRVNRTQVGHAQNSSPSNNVYRNPHASSNRVPRTNRVSRRRLQPSTRLPEGTHNNIYEAAYGTYRPILANNFRQSRYIINGESSYEGELPEITITASNPTLNKLNEEALNRLYPNLNIMKFIDDYSYLNMENLRNLTRPLNQNTDSYYNGFDDPDSYYNSYRNYRNALIDIYKNHKGDGEWINPDNTLTPKAEAFALNEKYYGLGTGYRKRMQDAGDHFIRIMGAATSPILAGEAGFLFSNPATLPFLRLGVINMAKGLVADKAGDLISLATTQKNLSENIYNMGQQLGLGHNVSTALSDIVTPSTFTGGNWGKIVKNLYGDIKNWLIGTSADLATQALTGQTSSEIGNNILNTIAN